MALFTYIILLAFLNITLAEYCLINNVPEQMAFEKQLRKDLRCDDQGMYEPPSNSSAFTVNLRFILKRFAFDSDIGMLSIQTWMFISWKDERLKWDPDKYYGINETDMLSFYIWTPSFRLFNSVGSSDFDRFYYETCHLKSSGQVRLSLRNTYEAFCDVKLTKWPYDQQECSFIFGAWSAKSTHFTLNTTSRAISLFGAEYGAEWFISDYRQVVNHSSDRQLTMTFVLEREAGGLAAIVVYPAVILTVLSVTTLFLDVRRFVRLAIACFSLMGHYYFLKELAANIPKQSAEPPNLLLYYRGSTVLTILIVMFSFLLRILCKWKSTPQSYVISTNVAVFESVGKHFIFPLWNVEDDTIDVKRFNQDWTKFANIINCVFSAVIIVAYISMYCVLVPQPIPITY